MENPAFKNSGENQENVVETPEIPNRSSSSSSSSSDESKAEKDPGLSADPRYNQFFWLGLFCPCPAAYILSRELKEGESCMRHLFPLIAGLIFAIALVATGAVYASDPDLGLEMGLIITGCITGLCILIFCFMLYLLRLHYLKTYSLNESGCMCVQSLQTCCISPKRQSNIRTALFAWFCWPCSLGQIAVGEINTV